MRVGDIVMFIDEGLYAKWFYGQLGIVEKTTERTRTCRVKWLQPVRYFDRYASVSDFGWDKFEGYQNESR
jgi:hypothetical protein